MTAYQRDDGAEMVEWKPGFTVRRDVGLRLGLIAPEVGFGARHAAPPLAALSPAAPPEPEPIAPPPLQPSHEDLVSIAPAPETVTEVFEVHARKVLAGIAASHGMTYEQLTAPWPPAPPVVAPRPVRPRPAKRPLADILAASDRGFRSLRSKAKP